MLKEGDKAPDFDLPSVHRGGPDEPERVRLKDFKDRTLVLFFYPKDSTPGCTREAQAFTAAAKKLAKAGAAALGVSRDSLKSHCSFRDKYELDVPLASDPELAAHQAYGAWGEKVMYGKKVLGCIRSTFIIKKGKVARVFPKVKVDGHVDEVLEAIAELDQAKA